MTDFILPDIGEGIVECELLEWLVEEGQHIVEDQPVAEVMTDKATVQIPAMHSGVVTKLYYQQGDIAKVHAPLFAIELDSNVSSEQQSLTVNTEDTKPIVEASGNAHQEDFILPDIGEGIVECELVKWLIAEGDNVEEDQAVVEVMTDKAVVEIPAKHGGTITKLYYQEGEIAKVHTPLFAIEVEGSSAPVPQAQASTPSAEVAESTAQPSRFQQGEYEAPKAIPGRVLASPAVRRLAREHGVDLGQVTGSGKKGRVMKQDVVAVFSSPQEAPAISKSEVVVSQHASGGTRVEPIRGIKAAMARQMKDSIYTIPHFSVSDEINMDALIGLRKTLKADFEKQGVKLSFMPFIIKAMSLALKQFPIINAQVNDDCTEITYFDDHNIGMAVDSKIGLLVPNIKRVQQLSLFEIAQESDRLIGLAREGKLAGEDLKGGTISISNIGVIGGTTATPVINKPEAAIVALGKMQKLPRFDDNDQVVATNLMHISWSGDHRIIDGATMVRFSNTWKDYLENPMTMLADLR